MNEPAPVDCPVLNEDYFSDENLANPAPFYQRLRDMGEAIWYPKMGLYIIPRYRDVVSAAKADDVLVSSQGVSMNEMVNQALRDDPNQFSTITADGIEHKKYKRFLLKPLLSKSVAEIANEIEALADELIKNLTTGKQFDGMSQLSCYLPFQIIAKMVGIKDVDNERMMSWASAVFDGTGPMDNPRTQAAFPRIKEFVDYSLQVKRDDLTPGGWADQLMTAADEGHITMEEARGIMFDYVIPSLDTTIYSTSEMLYQLGTTPGAFDALRENPDLIRSTVLEAVRLATPLRGFARYVNEDYKLSEDITLPQGSRVWLLYASANRDERHYDDAESFKIDRNPLDHVGWGFGAHLCAGKHLAILEMESILKALIKYVERIEIGDSTRLINNTAQGWKSIDTVLHPK